MNHERARERLLDLCYGELGPAEARQVEAHLAGCEACRAERDALQGTRRAMRLLEPVPPPEGPERVLAAAAREAAGRMEAGRRRWWQVAWGSSATRLAATAALMVAVGGVSWRLLAERDAGPGDADIGRATGEVAAVPGAGAAKALAPMDAPATGLATAPSVAPAQAAAPAAPPQTASRPPATSAPRPASAAASAPARERAAPLPSAGEGLATGGSPSRADEAKAAPGPRAASEPARRMKLEAGEESASSPPPAVRSEAREVRVGGPEATDARLPAAAGPAVRAPGRIPDRLRPAETRDVACPDGDLHVVAWRDAEGRIRRVVRTFSGPGGRRSESVLYDEEGHPIGADGQPARGLDPSESFRTASCP